jgi:hypothetical protein
MAAKKTTTEVEMPHVRASIIPINKEQMDYIMRGLYELIGHHGRPSGPLGQLWDALAHAVRTQKRFIIEVENTE